MTSLEEYDYTLSRLRSCHLRGFENYKIDKMLSVPTEEVLVESYKKQSLFNFVRLSLYTIFKDSYYYNFDELDNTEVLLFYSHAHAHRPDYVNFMEILSTCSSRTKLFTGVSKTQGSLNINLVTLSLLFLPFFWLYEFRRKKVKIKFWQNCIISLIICYKWKELLKQNEKFLNNIKGLVTIFDAREYENVLTQLLSRKNIPTATLQHGHFGNVFYKDADNCYLGIEYKGFVSDFFYVWGETAYNNALSEGIQHKNLVKVGCPFLINKKSIKREKCTIGILFDGGINSFRDNNNLYTITSQFAVENNLKILVKLHPNDNIERYSYFNERNHEIFKGSLDEFASKVEYAVCSNTTCLITMLIWDVPVFHCVPEYMVDLYPELKSISFHDVESLKRLFKQKISPKTLLSKYTELGDIKENYRKEFEKLIK